MSHNGKAPDAPQPGRGSPGTAGEVVAHGRPSRLRSISIRIALPVVLATSAVVVLGVLQSRDALREARDGDRARVLAQTAATAVALMHHVELEYSELNLLRQRGGQAGVQLLTAAQARTDVAKARFQAAAGNSRAEDAQLGSTLDEAAKALTLLPVMRRVPADPEESAPELFDAYDSIVHELIAVADAVVGRIAAARLTEIARSLVLAAELEHLAAEQLDLLRGIFSRQKVQPAEVIRLAQWEGAEHQQLEELERLPGPFAERFEVVVSGRDVKTATEIRDKVLDTGGAPGSVQVDPDVWYVAQSGLLRRLRLLQIEVSATLDRTAYEIQAAAERRALAVGALTAGVVAVALTGGVILAIRTSRRLRRVRDAALTLARTELPGAIGQVTSASDAEAVRGALQESSGRMESMLAPGSDEIGELSVAFGGVHHQALRLAADQALLRMETEATFVALSRRGQTLVQRQIHLIDQFGRVEQDTNRLRRLFALDHLAARMRRNEENLLVLAGGEPGRRFLAPVPILDVIQAAAEETEDYDRIEMAAAPPVAVMAHAVGDVVHLLAELLENATSFSPPTTKVRVTVRQTVENLTVTVFDEGIGMPPEKLAEANDRLTHPSALTSSLVGTMGLLVVARLAQRHGVVVHLSSTPGGGAAATVMLPEAVLAPAHTDDQFRRARLRGSPPGIGADQVSYHVMGEPVGNPYAVQPVPVYVPAGAGFGGPVMPAERPAVVTTEYPTPVPYVQAHYVASPGPDGAVTADPPYPAVPGSDHFDAPRSAVVGYTAAGLPRRNAGATVPEPASVPIVRSRNPAQPLSGSPALGGVTATPGPPDPDVARARLSSLASGIAAANRRGAAPQPPS